MAMCVIAVVAFAPCQCFSPGLDRDHITWSNLLDWVSPALYQAAASCHDQGLAQRVGMPSRPSAWLKGNTGPNCTCRIGCFKQWVNPYGASKILSRSFTGRLGANSLDLHLLETSPHSYFIECAVDHSCWGS